MSSRKSHDVSKTRRSGQGRCWGEAVPDLRESSGQGPGAGTDRLTEQELGETAVGMVGLLAGVLVVRLKSCFASQMPFLDVWRVGDPAQVCTVQKSSGD